MLDRHRRFVEEYMIDGNGQNAYLRAYPEVTTSSAKESASRLLKRTDIRMELEKMLRQKVRRLYIR